LIREIFHDEEATIVFQLPLSPYQHKDKRIWRGFTNGEFMITIAYHLEKIKKKKEKRKEKKRKG